MRIRIDLQADCALALHCKQQIVETHFGVNGVQLQAKVLFCSFGISVWMQKIIFKKPTMPERC